MLCAYCGEDRPATKEHVWSASLIRLTEKEAPYTFDPHREKVYGAHPQLKDTCAPCNNLLLSPADAAMLEFAQRHLLGAIEPETVLNLGDPRLTRWVLKTAYNHDRSHPELRTRRAGMWRPILPSLLDRGPLVPGVEIWFGSWREPFGNGMLEGLNVVHRLDARELILYLEGLEPGEAERHLAATWGLKVACGVFALLVWQPSTAPELKERTAAGFRSADWLPMHDGQLAGQGPFNKYTAATYHVICHPDHLPTPGGRPKPVDEAVGETLVRLQAEHKAAMRDAD